MTDRRPTPPDECLRALAGESFFPAIDLAEWARATFIEDGAPLENPAHTHLRSANIAFLWTNEPNSRNGRTIIGQCELMPPMAMGKWQKGRAMHQLTAWFGEVPDFLITLSGEASEIMDDVSFCALVEHELYHAGQAEDAFGMPKFSKTTGKPVFAMRGHDVEEFVGVVERYGMAGQNMVDMVKAANAGPTIGTADVVNACGNCMKGK